MKPTNQDFRRNAVNKRELIYIAGLTLLIALS